MPIWVAMYRMGGGPRPASFSDLFTSSVGNVVRRPMACRIALLSMSSIVASWRSLNTPRFVAF
jgi:hypothetical protein